jgi:AraC-like DNA-binding protein
MSAKLLHRSFELAVTDLQEWEQRPLVYHFFEIVQIIDGEGVRIVNENRHPYRKGTLFIFTPLDCRGFESTTATRFCSIRFSEAFLEESRTAQERQRVSAWLSRLEQIFYHHNRFQALRLTRPGDEQSISILIQEMIREYEHRRPEYEENLQHLVTVVLNILARNVAGPSTTAIRHAGSETLINRILVHLRQNIESPAKLRIEHLAATFHLSPTYIGEYFQKLTGESLRRYILQYRLNLVRHRLANSTLTISQIADELGFTDVAHLNRQFRKMAGQSPGTYRKRVAGR